MENEAAVPVEQAVPGVPGVLIEGLAGVAGGGVPKHDINQ